MAKSKYNLGEFINMVNKLDLDIDVSVDGTDCYIAVCGGTKLTAEGKKHFSKALKLPMDGHCVISNNDKDYDDYDKNGTGALANAEELLYSLAGYCDCDDWDKWFKDMD